MRRRIFIHIRWTFLKRLGEIITRSLICQGPAIILTIILVLPRPVNAENWYMFHHDLAHTGFSADLGVNTPVVEWSFKTNASLNSFGGMRLSSPAVVDSMVFIGRSLTWGAYCSNVYVSGNFAYACEIVQTGYPSHGLTIIDISNPTSPVEEGFYNTGKSVSSVWVSGIYAYLAATDSGLVILNISTPSSPSKTGAYNTPGRAYDIYLASNYAYVADGSSGLLIIDVSIPSSPSLEGSYDPPSGSVGGVWVSGNYAYLADQNFGLRIVDISVPSSPTPVCSLATRHWAFDVMVSGNYAYVADGDSGLSIIDISNPILPFEVGRYDTPGRAFGVYVSANYTYLADGDGGMRIIDVSAPSIPIEVGFYDPYYTQGIYVSGSYAYLSATQAGLRILDISNVSSPSEISFYDYPDDVFCISATTGAKIWSLPAPGPVASSPAVTSDKVYFGTSDNAVYCLNKADGEQIWRYETKGQVLSSPAVAYGKVFICSFDSCLYCLDANTGALKWKVVVGLMPHTSPAVYEGRVFVGDGVPFGPPANFTCIDTSGTIIWQYQVGSGIGASPTVVDGKMYGGSDDGYLYCLNAMTNNPVGEFIWSTPIGGNFATPAVWNGRVFTVNDQLIPGLLDDYYVFCIDAANGSYIWQYDLTPQYQGGSGSSPAIAGGKVYLGLDQKGWIICLDAATTNPNGELLWSYQLPTQKQTDCSPAIVGQWLYIASRDSFLYAFWDENVGIVSSGYPATTFNNIFLNIVPNPFRQQTKISYGFNCAVDKQTNGCVISLKIYDSAGQIIKTILPKSVSLLDNTVIWDGTNDYGENVSSGIYFCEIQNNVLRKTAKIIRLR